jgi:hypothetical protein
VSSYTVQKRKEKNLRSHRVTEGNLLYSIWIGKREIRTAMSSQFKKFDLFRVTLLAGRKDFQKSGGKNNYGADENLQTLNRKYLAKRISPKRIGKCLYLIFKP